MRTWALSALALTCAAAAAADDQPPPATAVPKATPVVQRPAAGGRLTQVASAKQRYEQACVMFAESVARAESDAQRAALVKRPPSAVTFARTAARVVAEDPTDAAAFDALMWLLRFERMPAVKAVLDAVPGRAGAPPVAVDPYTLLAKHHVDNPKLGPALALATLGGTPAGLRLLEAAAETSRTPAVRGGARYRLALRLMDQGRGERLKDDAQSAAARRAEELFDLVANDPALKGVRLGEQAARVSAGGPVMEVVMEGAGRAARLLHDLAAGRLLELRRLIVGQPLPDVSGEGLDGGTLRLSDYRGKVVVVDVWATWCGPCRAMIPHEREMVKRLEGKPFALISVSCDDRKETLTNFLAKEPMPWVHWWVGREGALIQALNIHAVPVVYVLDAQGVIRHKGLRGEKLEEAVNELLKEQERAKSD